MPKAAPQSTTTHASSPATLARRSLIAGIAAVAVPSAVLARHADKEVEMHVEPISPTPTSRACPRVSAKEARWREIEAFAKWSDPQSETAKQLPLAIQRARRMGLDPEDFTGAQIAGRGYEKKTLILHFGDYERDGRMVFVFADRAQRWQKD